METEGEEQTYIDVAIYRGVMQRRIVLESSDIDVGAGADQLVSNIKPALIASFV